MKRIVGILGALVLGLFLLAPAATAADPSADRQGFLMSVNHDVTVPAGEHVDTLLVINGTATVAGDVGDDRHDPGHRDPDRRHRRDGRRDQQRRHARRRDRGQR